MFMSRLGGHDSRAWVHACHVTGLCESRAAILNGIEGKMDKRERWGGQPASQAANHLLLSLPQVVGVCRTNKRKRGAGSGTHVQRTFVPPGETL